MGWRNPLEQSEFEVQAEAYNQLRKVYKNVRGELHFKSDGKRSAIFDLAILDSDNEIVCTIEVKRGNKTKFHKQVERYRQLTGKPCVPIAGMDDAMGAVHKVQGYIGIPAPTHPDIYTDTYARASAGATNK